MSAVVWVWGQKPGTDTNLLRVQVDNTEKLNCYYAHPEQENCPQASHAYIARYNQADWHFHDMYDE